MNWERARAIAIGVGLVVSSGLWLATTKFYADLGIAPADVGTGFAQVLERSIGALVLIALITVLGTALLAELVVPWLVLAWLVTPAPDKPIRLVPRDAARVPGQRYVRGSIVVAASGLAVLILVRSNIAALLSVACVTLILLFRSWHRAVVVDLQATWNEALSGVKGVARALRAPVAVVTVLGTLALFWFQADDAAQRVKDGKAVDTSILGFASLSIRATPTLLKVAGVDQCVMYLGASDGAAVVYDPDTDVVERIPAGDLRVTLDSDFTKCPTSGSR